MRFKNFINNFSKRNRIFSDEDMFNMPLGNLFDNEDELYSQYQSIGFPNTTELKSSPNVQWIEPYTNQNGLQDGGFWQSILQQEYNTPASIQKQTIPVLDWQGNNKPSFPFSTKKYLNNNDNDTVDELPENLDIVNTQNEQNNKPFELGIEKNVYLPQEEMTQTKNENNLDVEKYLEELINPAYLNKISQNDNTNIEQNNNVLDEIKENLKERVEKVQKDYENLTPVEQAQKWTSKHFPNWTPAEYYGISEYLADDGKLPEKYEKHNYHCKLGDITNERTKEIITNKVLKARKDCPVGPYIKDPLEDVDVIVPKDSSELVQKVKRSDEIKDFIEKHKSELDAGKTVNGSINFDRPRLDSRKNENIESYVHRQNDEIGRFSAIHYADIVDAKKNEDGSVTMKVVDYYDFTRNRVKTDYEDKSKKDSISWGENVFNKINNRAYHQQLNGQLKPYAMYFEFTYKLQ